MIKLLEQDPKVRKVALGTPAGLVAFGFGSGLSRYAPGTVGTVAAIPFAFLLKSLPPSGFWLLLGGGLLAGIYLCDPVGGRLLMMTKALMLSFRRRPESIFVIRGR